MFQRKTKDVVFKGKKLFLRRQTDQRTGRKYFSYVQIYNYVYNVYYICIFMGV